MKNQTMILALIAAMSCQRSTPAVVQSGNALPARLAPQLPTGVRLDPAAPLAPVGPMPLTMRAAPGNDDRAVLLLSGFRQQGVQVISTKTGAVLQTIPQAAAFVGLAFSPDGKTLYSSGGNQDVVYSYDWGPAGARLRDSLILAKKARDGTRYPAGLAVSADGKWLYVAENLADSLAVIDLATGRVAQRLATGRYPYDVLVAPDQSVYVSAWGATYVAAFHRAPDGLLREADWIEVGRHPSALAMNRAGTMLFAAMGSVDKIAKVAIPQGRVVKTLSDAPPAGPSEGATPNALALDANDRLFVAEADANAVAVFEHDSLVARIPTGWYPSSLLASGSGLWVAAGKGTGTHADPTGPQPEVHPGSTPMEIPGLPAATNALRTNEYTLNAISGGVMHFSAADLAPALYAGYTQRVIAANGWNRTSDRRGFPPIHHVVYVIKENRTYDQVLGDLTQADGDSSLVYFPRAIGPNHHALAERFGIFDRFFVNAEVSPDGHNWSTAAYAGDYLQKTVPSNYSGRGRPYDYEGTNRNAIVDDDVNEGGSGYLWDLATKAKITFRDYGEFATTEGRGRGAGPQTSIGTKPALREHVNPRYPVFNTAIKDTVRANVWLEDLQNDVKAGTMPALQIVRLGNDHTSYAQGGRPIPRAAFADNDLALGRMIEALSNTSFWASTAVFVVEDDAQNGSDHVDSHRSLFFIISAYSRPGVYHRFANTTDALRTIEELLGLGSMSQFDYFGRPIRDIWSDTPNLTPYVALTPAISLDSLNPRGGRGEGHVSERFDLSEADRVDDEVGNRVLWKMLKGDAPYPGPRRASAAEFIRR